ncbi:MAG TPA: apolipoprotein N-acyltransferase [Rhizomicrobium sp.]
MTSYLLRSGIFLEGLTRWRRFAAAFAAGAISALGFAPVDAFALFLLGFAVFVILLDGANSGEHQKRNAALTGWAFGFGQFVVGMHWIFYPFLVDPVEHAWQIPFVALLFPGGLALFPMLAALLASFWWKPGASRIFALATTYAAAEWLRGHVLTGLPWNLPAYSWGLSLEILQSASLVGAYGLSFLTILFGASLAELFSSPPRLRLPVVMAASFVLMWVAGYVRLSDSPTTMVAGVHLRIVQPNIPQDEKYRRDLVQRNWRRLIDLSKTATVPSPTIIVWPEAAPPILLQLTPEARDEIADLTGANRVLITGNQRMALDSAGHRIFFNSLYVFGAHGRLLSTYDKFHLVPFGEYLPFEPLLRALGITKLVGFPGSFAAGDGPHTYPLPHEPSVGPLICYEILFPSAVIGEKRPDWLVNVTDDSWFGPWAGPQQHLLAARVRAIEEGLPVARSANTGISAVIDPVGRKLVALGLDRTGAIDFGLPRALAMPGYAVYGDAVFLLLLATSAGLSWWLARK